MHIRSYKQEQNMEPEQKSPIHHRPRPQPFLNIIKKRRLSLSNHGCKQAEDKKHQPPSHDQNSFIARTRNKKKSTVSDKDTIENNYIRIQMMRQEEKNKWSVNPKNMLAFFPTYTTLVDTQAREMYVPRVNFPRNSEGKKQKSQHEASFDEINSPVQRSKLAPIRKTSKQQSLTNSKAALNLSFFNIEKVSLVPINPASQADNVRSKNSFTATLIHNKRALVVPSQSFDESKTLQLLDKPQDDLPSEDTEITTIASKTFQNMKNQLATLTVNRLRPFNPPFERFYYFDFLWKIAYSNRLKIQFSEVLPKKYKVYIGSGNNSMLIKTFFKRRESWWALTEKIEQANFIWTQIKVNNIFNWQKNGEPVQKLQHASEELLKKKNNFQFKKNSKLLNQKLLENWLDYYEKNKDTEEKLAPSFARRNKLMKTTNFRTLVQCEVEKQRQKVKTRIHNHLPRNYVLGNKKALFATMKKYYESSKDQVFQYLPLTFHIENGLEDKQYFKFLQYFYKKGKQCKESQGQKHKVRNIWIVKPGEFTNRGNGITVCRTLEQIKSIVKHKKKLDNGNMRTYILQEYLDRPFLYCKRKFDIRHYMMITCVNGHVKGYWYELGYIRTTSYEYSVKNGFSSVHLTNDAVQKLLPDYGKYEKGNKLSYEEFEKYLEREYKGKYSFYKTIYPQMRKIGRDSMRACSLLIDQDRKEHNFEIFGFDFMIDSDFHPWLIEINTNPCLELSCPVLMDVIPAMVENALKIGVDSVLPPPFAFAEKRPRFGDNVLAENKFELLYDSAAEEDGLRRLLLGQQVNLNYRELQKDEDQVYEDDGVQLQD